MDDVLVRMKRAVEAVAQRPGSIAPQLTAAAIERLRAEFTDPVQQERVVALYGASILCGLGHHAVGSAMRNTMQIADITRREAA